MKTYNETRVNVSGVVKTRTVTETNAQGEQVSREDALLNSDGTLQTQDLNNIVEKKFNEITEEHKKAGWPEPQPSKIQTFEYTEPESVEEIVPMLVSAGLDEAVAKQRALDVFLRGWAIEQQGEIRAFMAKSDAVEGAYSVLKDAATPAERRQKDPLATAASALKKAGFDVTLDGLKAILEQFKQPAAAEQPVA